MSVRDEATAFYVFTSKDVSSLGMCFFQIIFCKCRLKNPNNPEIPIHGMNSLYVENVCSKLDWHFKAQNSDSYIAYFVSVADNKLVGKCMINY